MNFPTREASKLLLYIWLHRDVASFNCISVGYMLCHIVSNIRSLIPRRSITSSRQFTLMFCKYQKWSPKYHPQAAFDFEADNVTIKAHPPVLIHTVLYGFVCSRIECFFTLTRYEVQLHLCIPLQLIHGAPVNSQYESRTKSSPARWVESLSEQSISVNKINAQLRQIIDLHSFELGFSQHRTKLMSTLNRHNPFLSYK